MATTLVFGHADDNDEQQSTGFLSSTSSDAVEAFVGLLWAFAFAHGITPLKADDVAAAAAAGREIHEHEMTAPDGDPAYIAFDVTDAAPGALDEVTGVLREVGL